jgi:formamidopyrimidine-DNA glycosylase
VPELPDICAYMSALEPRIVGRPLRRVRLLNAFLLRTAEPPITQVEGRNVRDLRRIGKRIAIGLDNDLWLVIHLMIAGRLHWRSPGSKTAGRNALAAFDFPDGSLVLSEAGTKRRASLHVLGGEAALAAADPGGVEVLSSDLMSFRTALAAENRTLKRALTDSRIVSGIGNAYSDEILHAARLSPFAIASRLTEAQVNALYDSMRAVLIDAVDRSVGQKAATLKSEKRSGLSVHARTGLPCPVCGDTVSEVSFADKSLQYCPTCQTGGKGLADRRLSRLVK